MRHNIICRSLSYRTFKESRLTSGNTLASDASGSSSTLRHGIFDLDTAYHPFGVGEMCSNYTVSDCCWRLWRQLQALWCTIARYPVYRPLQDLQALGYWNKRWALALWSEESRRNLYRLSPVLMSIVYIRVNCSNKYYNVVVGHILSTFINSCQRWKMCLML